MLSIGVFSRISKVTTNTLRYYDEIGLLKPNHINSENGYRYYDVSQLRIISLINKLKSYSFSLEEIATVLNTPNNKDILITMAKHKKQDILDGLAQQNTILKQLEHDILNLERGVSIMADFDQIEVKLVETEPKNVLFIRATMSTEEYGKYMGKLYETIMKNQLTPTGPPMTLYYSEEFSPENFDCEIAIPVKEVVKGTRELPNYLCAKVTHKGPYSELSMVYSRLQEWIEKERYQVVDAAFEVYLTNPRETMPKDYITEVYLPIKKI